MEHKLDGNASPTQVNNRDDIDKEKDKDAAENVEEPRGRFM